MTLIEDIAKKLEELGFEHAPFYATNYGMNRDSFQAPIVGSTSSGLRKLLKQYGFNRDAIQYKGHTNYHTAHGDLAQVSLLAGAILLVTFATPLKEVSND